MMPGVEEEQVILVDEDDRAIGVAAKLAAHREGRLHRAISVQLRDASGRLLLQKRHIGKYHSGGLWTNTCCSHPRPGEEVHSAARRRLSEEMNISCPLTHLFTTRYRAMVDNGMIEHELVHCFGGLYAGMVRPDPGEADGYAWIDLDELRQEVDRAPVRYSLWFRIYLRDHWPEITGSS
ncbi:MAG: isopentenyl-diphosphate Delta-isomerase [Hyphomicrobiaceae bacterium]